MPAVTRQEKNRDVTMKVIALRGKMAGQVITMPSHLALALISNGGAKRFESEAQLVSQDNPPEPDEELSTTVGQTPLPNLSAAISSALDKTNQQPQTQAQAQVKTQPNPNKNRRG